jgi:hypothetical protein
MATGSSDRETRTLRRLVWIAIVIVAVTDIGYAAIIWSQQSNPSDGFRVLFVATYLALMAAMLGISLFELPPIVSLRPALRAGAAAGLLVMGILAIF